MRYDSDGPSLTPCSTLGPASSFEATPDDDAFGLISAAWQTSGTCLRTLSRGRHVGGFFTVPCVHRHSEVGTRTSMTAGLYVVIVITVLGTLLGWMVMGVFDRWQ